MKTELLCGIKSSLEIQLCPGVPEDSASCINCRFAGEPECAKLMKGVLSDDLRLALMVATKELASSNPEVTRIKKTVPDADLYIIVTDHMRTIGIPVNLMGYRYVREALVNTIKNPDWINCITKVGYIELGEKFQTTPSRVERAIRHAIEVAWDRGDLDTLQEYFGYTISGTKGKPTNKEFLAGVANYIRMDMFMQDAVR